MKFLIDDADIERIKKLYHYYPIDGVTTNPSILKADILTTYPDFNERTIGFKRFSDVMKELEKEKLVVVEMDEQKTMLIKLL